MDTYLDKMARATYVLSFTKDPVTGSFVIGVLKSRDYQNVDVILAEVGLVQNND